MILRCALVLTVVALAYAQPAVAHNGIRIGPYSDQLAPSHAVIGAHIHSTDTRNGRGEARPREIRSENLVPAPAGRGQTATVLKRYPSLPANSPLLRNAHPLGPQSSWYAGPSGRPCIYVPGNSPSCFTLAAAAGNRSGGGLAPSVIASSVERRLDLGPGQIAASPARAGLTGATSWFWLDPAPQPRELSVSLAGETVTVSADPEVVWRFGDGATLTGGAGVPYQTGAVPSEAVTHMYKTRCLPGDRGRDPYVLSSCDGDGYSVQAVVVWRISYSAAGPGGESGTLPTRTTETSSAYPVSEARAFLASGSGGAG